MILIDAKGLLCPVPVIETKKAIAALPDGGGVVKVTVDNSIATENLSKMCADKGYKCEVTKKADREYDVLITVGKGENSTAPTPTTIMTKACEAGCGLVVAIGKDTMGGGSDELGRILIKGFIYSLLNLDVPPKAVLFFNSGVRLTVEGANTLDDLTALTQRGTEILVCGTCVDFYGLKEQVRVGGITNMYAIVEQLRQAGSVVNI